MNRVRQAKLVSVDPERFLEALKRLSADKPAGNHLFVAELDEWAKKRNLNGADLRDGLRA